VWDIISWPFKQIGNLLSGTVSVIKGIFGTVWDIVSWPFKQLGNLVSFTVDGITSVFKGMVDGISAVFGTVWTIISWPFKMIGSLVSNVFEGISNAIKFVVDKLSNVLGMIGSVIKGITGFVGSLFGGSEKKEEKSVSGSPEFTRATAVLLEAANKMNVAGDKLIASSATIGKNSAVAGSSMFDSVLSATGINKAVSDIKQKALNLPPISEEAKKIASTFTEDTGPSLEEKTHTELVSLNSTMKDLLRYIKDTADNTRKTHEATKSLNGNAFAA
jgi:phage-related protein